MESELIEFIGNLNKKHSTLKFEFTYFKTSLPFLDTEIYKKQNGILCNTTYRKPNDHHNFLHCDSACPNSLRDSTLLSQALHTKQIYSETEGIRHFKHLKDTFIKQGYTPEFLAYHFIQCMWIEIHF